MTTYRNKFEEKCAEALGPVYDYEAIRLPYTTQHTYTPDFIDLQNKRVVEAKGFFSPADRAKMLAVKAQHPDWSFAIQFQNPERKLNKASKTTYRMWAEKHGFEVLEPPAS